MKTRISIARSAALPTIACVLLMLTGCGKPANDPSARDAAPGPASETTPPSAPVGDHDQGQPSTDTVDQPPHR